VVVPPTPGAAVVKGAVIYGLNPKVVAARIARRTYGVLVKNPFKDIYNPAFKFVHPDLGIDYCDKVFHSFVKAGQCIPVDHIVTQFFCPDSVDSTSDNMEFLSCTHPDPIHTDEVGVRIEGNLEILLPGKGLDRRMVVTMMFGRAQINIIATNNAGEHLQTQLQFAVVGEGVADDQGEL
jgi:hypothetical protein